MEKSKMRQSQRSKYSRKLVKWTLLLMFGLAHSTLSAELKTNDVGGTYGEWNKSCHNAKYRHGNFLMGAIVHENDKFIYLYWEQNINSGFAQYFSAGIRKDDKLYVSGKVGGELCKSVFQVRDDTLSYEETDSDECMNNLGMGAYLSNFKNVRISHEEMPPKDADQSYRNSKWHAAWEEASKQCPASH